MTSHGIKVESRKMKVERLSCNSIVVASLVGITIQVATSNDDDEDGEK